MAPLESDVAILGSGFGGSLMALLLERIGLRPVLIDRAAHPRFAIGESSTPVADFVLRDLARDYDLPWLEPLSRYGTWLETYPQLVCGLKRGFSYFHHEPGREFLPNAEHTNELLVAASSDDHLSDTHWLRADVDAFLCDKAQQAGVPFFDRTDVSIAPDDHGWLLTGRREDRELCFRARFLIDATGEAGALLRALGIANDPAELKTNSRTVFAHFTGVRPWREHLLASGGALGDHPFDCDCAALHQILDEGWMWQLRFRDGVTSAGFVLDGAEFPLDPAIGPADEWNRMLDRYPSIAAQFDDARIVNPPGGLRQSRRLQRLARQIAGPNWVLLPNTAGFIDPLHSTGIAQTLCGIERLAIICKEHWGRPTLTAELQRYASIVRNEIVCIDRLVSGCYLARRHFRLFTAFAMLYFAAATIYEHRRESGLLRPGGSFLCADDPELRRIVREMHGMLERLLDSEDISPGSAKNIERTVAAAIRPFNHVGLFDPAARNMYRHTAAPKR